MSINGYKTNIHEANVKRKKRKVHENLTTSLKIYEHSPSQKCLILTLPLSTRLLSTQNYFPFLSRMTKGKSLRVRHLVITRRASIITSIVILISQSLWKRRWRGSETTKASLLTCYTT